MGAGSKRRKKSRAERFQVIGIDLDGHTPHDLVQREHNAEVVFLPQQHALQAGQRTRFDPCSLSDCEIGVGLDFPQLEAGAQRFDFKVRERRWFSPPPHDRQYPRDRQHACALTSADLHEQIIGKQRQFQRHLAAVRPAAHRWVQRQK